MEKSKFNQLILDNLKIDQIKKAKIRTDTFGLEIIDIINKLTKETRISLSTNLLSEEYTWII